MSTEESSPCGVSDALSDWLLERGGPAWSSPIGCRQKCCVSTRKGGVRGCHVPLHPRSVLRRQGESSHPRQRVGVSSRVVKGTWKWESIHSGKQKGSEKHRSLRGVGRKKNVPGGEFLVAQQRGRQNECMCGEAIFSRVGGALQVVLAAHTGLLLLLDLSSPKSTRPHQTLQTPGLGQHSPKEQRERDEGGNRFLGAVRPGA